MTHSNCLTYEDMQNRRHAKFTAMLAGAVCLTTISIAAADALRKDWEQEAKIAAMNEREEAERAIRESLDFGRIILNDRDEIISYSAAVAKWAHWPDAVGQKIYKLLPSSILDEAIEKAKSAQGLKKKVPLIEYNLPRVDDPTKTTAVTIALSVVTPKHEPKNPYVVMYVYRTKSLHAM